MCLSPIYWHIFYVKLPGVVIEGPEEPVVLPVFEKMSTPPYDPCRCEHRCKQVRRYVNASV